MVFEIACFAMAEITYGCTKRVLVVLMMPLRFFVVVLQLQSGWHVVLVVYLITWHFVTRQDPLLSVTERAKGVYEKK